MNEVTLNPPTGAGTVAPAGPVPQASMQSARSTAPITDDFDADGSGSVPVPRVPVPPPIAIPPGEPAAVALVMLAAVAPDAPAVLKGRIERIEGELADQVEEARLDARHGLVDFVGMAGRRVKLLHALEARAGRPAPRSAAAEVLALVQSVRRWRPSEELRRDRGRIVGAIRGELQQVEGRIGALMDVIGGGGSLVVDAGGDHARSTGLVHQHDEWLRRAEALLKTRAALLARLAKLDAQGDEGRAQAAREAIERAGGPDDLVAALTPSMVAPAADELARVRKAAADLGRELERIDGESRRAAAVAERKLGLEARFPSLAAAAGEQRTAAAAALVSAALGGSLESLHALELAAKGIRPELAESINSIRAGESDLVATIAEMIGE